VHLHLVPVRGLRKSGARWHRPSIGPKRPRPAVALVLVRAASATVRAMETDADRAALEASLAGRGEHGLFACDPALADTAAFCAAYGFALEDSANTIVVVGKSNPPVYAACVVLATHRLDVNHAVRDRLGTRKASFASADETRTLTGHEIGGVTAFGLPDGMPLLVDAAVMTRPRIVLGGGSRSWKVLAPPSILLTIPGVQVVDGLANPAPPREAGAGT
jgi:prolyl-tRNA editing enzyme YbaK/EbsC (Cys-tRNA(Pro) deacylase)